ncbi:MAG: amidohydrolase, partial [Lentisphaeria bacterium]|nr:amidohydrolase [Lentisphaeria bacterium]
MKETGESLKDLYSIICEKKDLWEDLSSSIWSNPELAYKEYFACKKQLETLALLAFPPPVNPYCGLETAYRAEFENGEGGPVFGICAEYDALPGLGHGCGHNLICTAALAAFYAMRERMKKENIAGKVVLFGTPAEESYGGKVKMLAKNCLDKVDAVVMVHPSARCIMDAGSTAICRYDVTFHGKASHAAAAPELGLNALDAVLLLFNAVNAFRQQMPDCCRIHGIVKEGGEAPNIIPDRASCRFFLRSLDQKWM